MNHRKIVKRSCFIIIIIIFFSFISTYCFGAHGLSLNGKLKYPDGFKKFEYTSNKAKKGGELILHDIGSFDKMNPFTLKGVTPLALESLIFEPLAVRSLDEPFAIYGLIAKDIEVSEDKLSMIITIDPKARFSDGSEVTAEDVLFSLNILKSDLVNPHYAYYFHDIKEGEILGKYTIKFLFSKINRELPLISLEIPVLSKKFYEKYSFGKDDTLISPVGTGPYTIDKVVQGKTIVYKRNPNYWAKDKGVRNNQYNFDKITVKYYKDQTVSVEAFKAGDFDVQFVNIAKQWARDLTGKKFNDGTIIKKKFPHHNNAGMQCFVMNLRKPLFKDIRVRQALGLAFDFEWTNKSLFFNQYTRSDSFFSNSYLAAKGVPQGLELKYLNEFKDILPETVFNTPLKPPVNNNQKDFRKHLRKAKKLLNQAGWSVKDGILKNSKGEPFEFEIILISPSFNRVMAPYSKNLERLGIKAEYRVLDQALYVQRVQSFDFDMTVSVFGQSLSPGNEQKNYWHSTTADIPGSNNVAGIKSPVVDALVEKIIYATNQEELVAATKALDRVLWYGYYVIPNWHLNNHRIAYFSKFRQPETLPKYYDYFSFLMTWWAK